MADVTVRLAGADLSLIHIYSKMDLPGASDRTFCAAHPPVPSGRLRLRLHHGLAEPCLLYTSDLFQPIHEPDIILINIRSLKDPRKLYYQLSAGQRFGNDDILNNKTDGTLNDNFYRALKKRVYIFTWEHFYPCLFYTSRCV